MRLVRVNVMKRTQQRLLQQLLSNKFSTHLNDITSSHTEVVSSTLHELYPNLLQPLKLSKNVTLKNRVLMGSMHTGLEESGGFLFHSKLDQMASFYAERAKGQVGLIVTGGISPNEAGKGYFGAAKMSTSSESKQHAVVTQAVHDNGGKIVMQILHTGRYGYHPWIVSSSPIKAPIGWFTPKELSTVGVYETIDDFVRCAVLAKSAGYDGVEVMGSEGYLINQFLVTKTNKRTDEWGGSYENRSRLPKEIVRRVRQACGEDFIIIYRLSMLDLVDDGSSWEEIVQLAKGIEVSGASMINTGIGWHEARIPTIATAVPRGAFSWVTKKMKGEVSIPLCTTNRINSPDVAEDVLAKGCADMISMARPFLADPYFVKKAMEKRADEINTCIGCNQACLDHIFVNKKASCLVNPVAAHETELIIRPVEEGKKKRIAVVGAGPAGLSFATTAASRGHEVTLFDRDSEIGGQFNMAKLVPGKEEFHETLRYFKKQLEISGVNVRLNTSVTPQDVRGFDSVVIATGVTPRKVNIPINITTTGGGGKVKCYSYIDVLKNKVVVGKSVAIIGAGGIGYDVADYITHDNHDYHSTAPLGVVDNTNVHKFLKEWGIDADVNNGGLMVAKKSEASVSTQHASERKVYLLQRKKGKLGSTLGKTTGWIHRTNMKKRGVEELSGCKYVEINDEGLVIEQSIVNATGKADKASSTNAGSDKTKHVVKRVLPVDTVIFCAGQEPLRDLHEPLIRTWHHRSVFLIGGAYEAGELDAKRAIDQGTRLAAEIEDARTGEVYEAPVEMGHQMMKFVESVVYNKK